MKSPLMGTQWMSETRMMKKEKKMELPYFIMAEFLS